MVKEERTGFKDRKEAGLALADALAPLVSRLSIVAAIPRGGVVVAAPIARRLGAPLTCSYARKLTAPIAPEVAFGALDEDGEAVTDREVVAALGLGHDPPVQHADEGLEHVAGGHDPDQPPLGVEHWQVADLAVSHLLPGDPDRGVRLAVQPRRAVCGVGSNRLSGGCWCGCILSFTSRVTSSL